MKRTAILLMCGLLVTLYPASGQVPFNLTPNWISTDVSNYSTGASLADINKDGWLDLVVANGNDMARQRVVVYYNSGTGSFPPTPGWQSSDIDYHGHLTVGDVNGDGWPDVAVSVYIGAAGFSQKGRVKLYLNNNGTLSSTPAWISKDSLYTFSCAFGDADGDGDLDLAVAGGESYNNRSEQNRIYYNNGGTLDSLPGWKTGTAGFSYDVAWADVDNDGDLDLVFANEKTSNRIYMNYGDSIGTVPTWNSTDASLYANSLFVGDVNNDGFFDIAISDNNQLGGAGRFKIYLNNGGTVAGTPFWSSAWSGYGSGINLADIDNDGDLDLVTGGWWQPCRIYTNQGGTFTSTPQWTSTSTSVVEAIVFGDVDNDRLDTLSISLAGNGSRKLFYTGRSPLHRIDRIRVGSDTLARHQYCYDLENGWISLAAPPQVGSSVYVDAIVSRDLDFVISNWDSNKGNYLFLNTTPPVAVSEEMNLPPEFRLGQNFPNPFNPVTNFQFSVVNRQLTILKVYDMLGREVATLMNEEMNPGTYEVMWDATGMASGVYFYRIEVRPTDGATPFTSLKKMMLLK